nr:MAG TPA: hypothetical protein [Caudoviricetes sp.]
MQNQDPIIVCLARIEAKLDEQIKNQERMDAEIRQIHTDTKRTALAAGAAAGAASSGIVTLGLALLRAKYGF